jgi:hypothetical protein
VFAALGVGMPLLLVIAEIAASVAAAEESFVISSVASSRSRA